MVDSELLYIFGISALGVASIAYVLFGFSVLPNSSSNRKSKFYIRGLKNVKNNCFINSILQSLASSESMTNWLGKTNLKFKNDSNLIFQLSAIVDRINKMDSCISEVLTPEGVLNSLRKHRWVFTNDEQDAFELFSVLISTLDTEFNQLLFALSIRDSLLNQVNNLDELSNKIKFISRVSKSYKSTDIPLMLKNSLPTRGILSNCLTCQSCHHSYPIHLDIFNSISLSLPPVPTSALNSSILLENCLRKFISNEEIEDFLCQYCDKKSTFIKKIEFIKLPQLLCFHIQRLVWMAGNQPLKRIDHVKFPEILIMDPFKNTTVKVKSINHKQNDNINSKNSDENFLQQIKTVKQDGTSAQNIYILNSVIVHLGNDHSGHFICYRRSNSLVNRPKKTKWYYTSDLLIKEVTKKEVLLSCAYMLFYEKTKKNLVDICL